MARIAVLGGGNGGHCMAADMKLAGHEVSLYELPRFRENVEAVLETKEVRLSGIGRQGVARLDVVTTDIEEALEGASVVNVVVPAFGHGEFFRHMLPHLQDGQTVVMWSADFGSLELAHVLERQAPDLKVDIVETNTLPYGTRVVEPGWVDLLLAAPSVRASCLPASENARVLQGLKQIFPMLDEAPDVLSAAFSNPNPIVHPPGSLLNTGRIQYSGGAFNMYREGITEAVARVIRLVFEEVARVAEAYRTGVITYEDRDFRTTGSIMAVAFQAPFDTLGVVAGVKGPSTVHDRYITEDLPQGLVPISQLADKVSIPTPLVDSIINLGSAVCDRDFWQEGRTLDKLGLDDKSPEEIVRLVKGR